MRAGVQRPHARDEPRRKPCGGVHGQIERDQIGPAVAVTIPADELVNGLFTVDLDFGADAFTGQARWLEVEARTPAWDGVGAEPPFVMLTPRQGLTPAPYALALPGLWPQQTATSPHLVGGGEENSVTSGVVGATVSGGGSPLISGNPRPNRATKAGADSEGRSIDLSPVAHVHQRRAAEEILLRQQHALPFHDLKLDPHHTSQRIGRI